MGLVSLPEYLPRLTERFYRVNTAQSRATKGTGLGFGDREAYFDSPPCTIAHRIGGGAVASSRHHVCRHIPIKFPVSTVVNSANSVVTAVKEYRSINRLITAYLDFNPCLDSSIEFGSILMC